MLCKVQNVKKLFPRIGFCSILFFFLNTTAILRPPAAMAQDSSEQTAGIMSGTVLLKASKRPASQAAVRLNSNAAAIYLSVLTDSVGHFDVRSPPRRTD